MSIKTSSTNAHLQRATPTPLRKAGLHSIEATDALYCPEGWYEWNEHEEVHWCVTSTPVAWCALPAPSSAKGVAP